MQFQLSSVSDDRLRGWTTEEEEREKPELLPVSHSWVLHLKKTNNQAFPFTFGKHPFI